MKKGNSYTSKIVSKLAEIIYNGAKFFRYAKIRVRLLILFVLLSSVPLFILGYFSYSKSSTAIETKIESYSSEIAVQSAQNIRSNMKFVESNFNEIQNNKDMMEVLNNFDQGSISEQELSSKIYNTLSGKFSYSSIDSCIGFSFIYNNKYILCNFNNQITDFTGNEKAYSKIAKKANGKPVWLSEKGLTSSEPYILSLYEIYNQTSGDPLITIVVFFDKSYLYNMLQTINIDGSNDLVILDPSGRIITNKDSNKLTIDNKYLKIIAGRINNDDKKSSRNANKIMKGTFQTSINSSNNMVCYSRIKDTDWNVVGTIPMTYIKTDSQNIMNTMFSVGAIIFILAIIISLFISTSITTPLNRLENIMRETKGGNLDILIKDKYNDEISSLSSNFNEMLNNIRNLVYKVTISAQKVLKSSQAVNELSSVFHMVSEQIADSMQQIANGTSEQAVNNSKTLEFVNILSCDIYKVGSQVDLVSGIISDAKILSENALTVVKTLNEKSEQTNIVTNQIVSNINTLNNDIKEIQKVVKFIGNISEQTKMLSFNASIEAARAGTAGRGFDIVAEQIGKLSVQTRESLRTISEVINKIESKAQITVSTASNTHEIIKQQMEAVNKTDNSFKEIFASLDNINKYMGGFENSVDIILQSGQKTLEEINNISSISEVTAANVEEVTATTQQQMAGVDEVADQAKLLHELAQELNNSISIFKV